MTPRPGGAGRLNQHARRILRPRGFAVLLLALILSISGLAAQVPRRQPQRPAPPRPQQRQPEYFQWLKSRQDLQEFSRLALKNGLRLLVAENHESPLAEIVVHIAASRGMPGEADYWVAPATLRYLFAGTQKRTAKQISDQLWILGIQPDIECSSDGLQLRAKLPADQVNRAVDLYSDLLVAPLFPESALAEVQNTLLRDEARNWARIASGADYRHPWIGTQVSGLWERVEQGIRQVTRAQVLDFWNRSAAAGQISLLIYGDFLPESVLDFSVRRLKDVPVSRGSVSAPAARKVPALAPAGGPLQAEGSYRQLRSEITRSAVRIAFRVPSRKDPDYPAILLASYSLAEGRMSFLGRRLVDGKHIGFSLRRFVNSFSDQGGEVCLQIESNPADLDTLEIELFTAIEQWRKSPQTSGDRGRALALAARDYFAGMETFEGRALALLRNELGGRYRSWFQELEALTKVSHEDMTRVAEKYFQFGRAEITELLPARGEPRSYTPAGFRKTFEAILGEAAKEVPAADALIGPQREPADIPSLIGKFAGTEIAPAPYRTSILRGPELQIWEIHSLPLVDIGIFFPGGIDKETPEKAGMTRLLLGVLLRNSAKYGFEDRFSALERWGGQVETIVQKDFFGYRLRILAPYAEQALDLMLDVLRNRAFTDLDIEQQLRIQNGEALAQADFLETRLESAADKLFGNHPYGRALAEPGSALKEQKVAQLLEWHSQLLEDVLPMVVVIGDTPGTSVATYFSKNYSGSRYRVVKPGIGATEPPKESTVLELRLSWPGQKGQVLALLGPEGENDETLLVQMAILAAEQRLASGFGSLAASFRKPIAPFGVATAWKGSRITLGIFSFQDDTVDLEKSLADALAAVETRASLENLKSAFVSRLRIGMQNRNDMMLNLATGFYCQGQFFSVSTILEKINAITLDEYQEALGRYFSQKQQVRIRLGQAIL